MAEITANMVKELRERTNLGMMECKKALVETNGDMEAAIKILRERGIIKSAKKAEREAKEGVIKAFSKDNGKNTLMMQVNCETDFVVRNETFQKLVDNIGNDILGDGNINSVEAIPEKVTTKLAEAIATIGENIKVSNIKRMKATNNEYIENYIHGNSKVGVLLKLKVEKPDTINKEEFKTLAKDLCMQIAAMDVKALTKDDIDENLIASEREIYLKQAKESGKPDSVVEKIVEGKVQKMYSEITLLGQNFIKDDQFTVEKIINKVSKDLSDKILPIEFAKFRIGE